MGKIIDCYTTVCEAQAQIRLIASILRTYPEAEAELNETSTKLEEVKKYFEERMTDFSGGGRSWWFWFVLSIGMLV